MKTKAKLRRLILKKQESRIAWRREHEEFLDEVCFALGIARDEEIDGQLHNMVGEYDAQVDQGVITAMVNHLARLAAPLKLDQEVRKLRAEAAEAESEANKKANALKKLRNEPPGVVSAVTKARRGADIPRYVKLGGRYLREARALMEDDGSASRLFMGLILVEVIGGDCCYVGEDLARAIPRPPRVSEKDWHELLDVIMGTPGSCIPFKEAVRVPGIGPVAARELAKYGVVFESKT